MGHGGYWAVEVRPGWKGNRVGEIIPPEQQSHVMRRIQMFTKAQVASFYTTTAIRLRQLPEHLLHIFSLTIPKCLTERSPQPNHATFSIKTTI